MRDNLDLTKDLNIITDGVQSISTSSITFSWPHHNAETNVSSSTLSMMATQNRTSHSVFTSSKSTGRANSPRLETCTLSSQSPTTINPSKRIIISISVPAFFLLVGFAYGYVRRQKQIKSYIPIRYAVEIERCDVDKGVEILHDLLPKHMRKQNTEKQKVMLSKLNSSCLPNELKIRGGRVQNFVRLGIILLQQRT